MGMFSNPDYLLPTVMVESPNTPILDPQVKIGKLSFPNDNVYKGALLNGKPHGLVTMTFKHDRQIYEHDINKQMASRKDKLEGKWSNGFPQVCQLYSA